MTSARRISRKGKIKMTHLDTILGESVFSRRVFHPVAFPLPVKKSAQLAPIKEIARVFCVALLDVEKHIGPSTTFEHKERLHEYLTILVELVLDPNIPEDTTLSIKNKVKEDAFMCTPGFMNRIQVCITGLTSPSTIQQLMASYRRGLVEEVASRSGSGWVHDYQLYFEVANEMGFEIPLVGVSDPYAKTRYKSQYKESLLRIFQEEYLRPSKLVEKLYQSAFASLGYAGKKQEGSGYCEDISVINNILSFFRRSLGDFSKIEAKSFLQFIECSLDEEENVVAISDINWGVVVSDTINYWLEKNWIEREQFTEKIAISPEHWVLEINPKKTEETLFFVRNKAGAERCFFLGNAHLFKDFLDEDLIKALESSAVCTEDHKSKLLFGLFIAGMDVSRHRALQVFKNHGHEMIKDGRELAAIWRALSDDRRLILFEGLSDHWHKIIKNRRDLSVVWATLSEDQRLAIFRGLQDHWHQMITSGYTLSLLLTIFSEDEKLIVIEALRGHWRKIIMTSDGLMLVLKVLSLDQRRIVLKELGNECYKMIRNKDDLKKLLEILSLDERALLFDCFNDHWYKIIDNENKLISFLNFLNRNEKGRVLQMLKDHLYQIITNGTCLSQILEHLGHADGNSLFRYADGQAYVVLDALKEHLGRIIKNAHELISVLHQVMYDENARRLFLDKIMTDLYDHITTWDSLKYVLSGIGNNPILRSQLFRLVSHRLPEIIQDQRAFVGVLKNLSLDDVGTVLKQKPLFFSKIIKNADHFVSFLSQLDRVNLKQAVVKELTRSQLRYLVFWAKNGRLCLYRDIFITAYIGLRNQDPRNVFMPRFFPNLQATKTQKVEEAQSLLRFDKPSCKNGLLGLINAKTRRVF